MVDVIITGEAGKIHAVYHKAEVNDAPLAVVFPGDPVHGCHMNDRVSYGMFRAFADIGFSVVRFNYRGVGLSSGDQSDPLNNMMDIAVVIDWIQNKNEESPKLWLAGYDFGAWLVMQTLMRRPEVSGFVMVSPNTTRQDFSFLSPRPNRGLLIQGDAEDQSSLSFGSYLTKVLKTQAEIKLETILIKGADAKYTSTLRKLYDDIKGYVGREKDDMKLL